MKKLGIVVIVLGIFLMSPVYADTSTGLVSYWSFDKGEGNIASDSSGNNDGVLTGVEWSDGMVNGAIAFDGRGDYVLISHDSSFEFDTGDFTISAWFNSNTIPSGRPQDIILDNWGSLGNAWPGFELGLWYGTVFIGIGDDDGDWINLYNPSYTLVTSQWYHVVAVKKDQTLKLYLDGELIASNYPQVGIVNNWPDYIKLDPSQYPNIGNIVNDADMTIGYSCDLYYKFGFNGMIDEVAVFDRAVSPEEIQHFYQNGLNGIGLLSDNNKGHGNDPDGVDEDNPGQGCAHKNANGNRKRCVE